jgi:hypothetical protein
MASAFALLVLIAINQVVRQFAPTKCLTQAELLVIYATTTLAVYISGIGMMQFLHPTLVAWHYYSTPENRWDKWLQLIPSWAVPDKSVIEDYYIGHSSFFTREHIAAWVPVIGIWTAFILTLIASLYCISSIMRRQWVDAEHLTFPIVQVALEITQAGGDNQLWRNKLFLAGAAWAIIVESIATVHFTMLPMVPYMAVKPEASLDLHQYFTVPPWNSIGYTTLSFYPMVIGLTYLLSLEVSFSCWFFYLFTKLEAVFCTAFGFRDAGAGPALAQMPYVTEQGFGAFVGLALFSLWLARGHIALAWNRAIWAKGIDDSNEPLSYRMAFIGLIGSALLLIGFAIALGLSPLTSLIFFALYFVLALAFTRIRAEAGLPWGHGPDNLVHGALINDLGTSSFSHQELAGFVFVRWFDSDWRCLPQTIELESMKIAASTRPAQINPRQFSAALLGAAVLGTLAAWICCLAIYYHFGASNAAMESWRTWVGRWPYEDLQHQINSHEPVNAPRLYATGVGTLVVVAMSLLRVRFLWWPLHPIGYAVGNTWTMGWIWFSVLIGWGLKALILRFGGSGAYRQALPLFIGLVLGDYAISGLWSLYFLLSGNPGYRTFPI